MRSPNGSSVACFCHRTEKYWHRLKVVVRGWTLVKIFVDVLSVSNNCYFNRVVLLIKISNNPIITNSKLVITSPRQSFKEMKRIFFCRDKLVEDSFFYLYHYCHLFTWRALCVLLRIVSARYLLSLTSAAYSRQFRLSRFLAASSSVLPNAMWLTYPGAPSL